VLSALPGCRPVYGPKSLRYDSRRIVG
jgi:hypothetical protein